jgi:hypothetical protein
MNFANLFNSAKKYTLDYWKNNKESIIKDMMIRGVEIVINNIKVLHQPYTTEKAQHYEAELYKLAASYEKENKEEYLNDAKKILEVLEEISKDENSNLTEIERIELNQIYYYHHSWINGNYYQF